MKKNTLQAIRGMNDILPEAMSLWQRIEKVSQEILTQYAYQQIRTPLLEDTRLFSRSIGDETDIVSKEMYSFADKNQEILTLRPEGTASCVRAGIQHGLFYNKTPRLWYMGPMFRYERPQKGRYRQFHQLGAECFGFSGADIEAEMLSMVASLFERLGLANTRLEINTLGDVESRSRYKVALITYLQKYYSELDNDSQKRLETNPLRILDSKIPTTQKIIQEAPYLSAYLSASSITHFEQLQTYLSALGIPYSINEHLVRGLDYYNDTVFEWVNDDFGAQSTVCAGGRYDGLVSQLGGGATPAIGFAIGLERLIQMLIEQKSTMTENTSTLDVYIMSSSEKGKSDALILQKQCVRAGLSVQMYCGEASLKNQFKKADKSHAKIALILGEEETQKNCVAIKSLRKTIPQEVISLSNAIDKVTNLLESL